MVDSLAMAIIHEAYLFKPDEFATEVLPYVRALSQGAEGQQALHKAVLERFENSSRARALAMEYGGWDSWPLHEDAARQESDRPQDIARWILFLLYDHLFPVPAELGLSERWRLMGEILRALQWHDSDRALPVHGHSFGYFAQQWLVDSVGIELYQRGDLRYWEHVWPGSTSSQIGWLDNADVERLLDKLTSDQPRLSGMNLHWSGMAAGAADNEAIQQTYQAALLMLRTASNAQCGVCLITSG
jgi:hypothetical protein